MRALAASCALALCACASDSAKMQSDWEMANAGRLAKEKSDQAAVVLPAYPRPEGLLPVTVSRARGFLFFVDRDALSVSEDRIVRYVLVARSPNGVDNVTYEGMNCRAGEYTVYALGRSEGRWSELAHAWRPIDRRAVQGVHESLYRDYFCPRGISIASAAEGLMAIRRGGHPIVQSPLPQGGTAR